MRHRHSTNTLQDLMTPRAPGFIPPPELYVFADRAHALAAGFTSKSGHQPFAPWMASWWPGRGHDCLGGMVWSRIVLTYQAKYAHLADPVKSEELADGLRHARSRLSIPPAVFIEL